MVENPCKDCLYYPLKKCNYKELNNGERPDRHVGYCNHQLTAQQAERVLP